MAIVQTKAIVLSAIKYGDSSLIIKCFTEKEGLKSYLIRGVLKSKKGGIKPALFQILNQLKLVANHNSKGNLNSIKEANISHPYKTIFSTIVKQAIVMFLGEVLSNCIQEEEENEGLYQYLEQSFIWFDSTSKIANFHLIFLLNLTKYLGFYPNTNQVSNAFDLLEGEFTINKHQKNIISGNELTEFKKLFNLKFENLNDLQLNKHQRQQILQTILKYYELHLEGFRQPKSLNVLESIFS